MFGFMSGRSVVLAAVACVVLGSGVVLAQASANASPGARGVTAAASPTPPAPPAEPKAGSLPPASGKVSSAAAATNAHCGQVLTASLTLNGDLFCMAGDALTITGTSVVLNLNGHVISGPGGTATGRGVVVTGRSDTVENGVIAGFNTGVQINGATDTVLNVRATYNADGIVDYGTSTKITNSVAASGTYYGIFSTGSGGTYSGDHELNNGVGTGYPGLYIGGQKMTITGNVANGNGGQGIDDYGVGTKLTTNTADFNSSDGIYAYDASVIDGAGNSAKGNDYATGVRPEQCYGVVCH